MEQHERLQAARKNAGFSNYREAAERFGWNHNTYKSHENGARGLKLMAARKYAKAFGVKVSWLLTGELEKPHDKLKVSKISIYSDAAGGKWLEDDKIETYETVNIAPIPSSEYPSEHQYARRVRGNSVSNQIRDGEIAIMVRFEHFPGAIPNGTLVCVKRTRPTDLVEYSIKVYRDQKLYTDSADLEEQEVLEMDNGEDGTIVQIEGVVLSAQRVFIS